MKRAAFAAFGVAVVAGLVLAATTSWWLVLVGALAIVAAWFYTGGSQPYGYRGLGEVMVFVFFGLVAVLGTTYVQTEDAAAAAPGTPPSASGRWPARSWSPTTCATSPPTGSSASARSRSCSATGGPATSTCCCSASPSRRSSRSRCRPPWALLGLAFLSRRPSARLVLSGTTGRALVPVLQHTGIAELLYAVGVFVGLLIG